MKPPKLFLLAALLGLALSVGYPANQAKDERSEVALQAAMKKETIDGDLKGAIEQYKRIAQSGSRAVAAKALVRMGECYEKLGDAESRKAYERVVRDYGDQKEAVAVARARLGPSVIGGRQTGTVARLVWRVPHDIYGTISRDGRYVPYVNWGEKGDLFVHDLATGADRRLTNMAEAKPGGSGEYAERSTFSRDGKYLAYSWFNGKGRYELRIVGLDPAGIPQARRLFDNEDVNWISPDDWSPDGKWLAVRLHRKDRSAQIGLVAVQDGSLRVLKSVDWRGPTRLCFSSDGQYLAFDLPATDTTEQRDVFVLAIDGSREIPAVVYPGHDALVGWSPDGKRLLFASDRSGTMGLWALAFADGRPQRSPELLKPDIGRQEFMGLATSGALYSAVFHSGGGRDIRIGSFDFRTGKLLSPHIAPIETFVGSNQSPDWSRDGKYLAYVSLRGSIGSRYFVIGIRSVETGQVRELSPSPGFFLLQSLRWAPDGTSLVAGGRDVKGRDGIFRIDAQTGQNALIVPGKPEGGLQSPTLSPDGKKLYYRGRVSGSQEFAVFERDLASGDERELIRRPLFGPGPMDLSPDGRYIATGTRDPSTNSSAALLVPVAGGEPRELMRAELPQTFGVPAWAPDSRSVLVVKRSPASGQHEAWFVSLDGESRKLALGLDPQTSQQQFVQLRAHPDGRQVAFELSGPQKPNEVWVLENFLPTLSAKK